ncbi:MAG: Uncharacterized protein G01um101416_55 [Microgenomates group bacterium Gr01-1014_16]|nr:MAG: Uncharacterized protein G01um101416_55 [Microgenomates group bacterium Gr01-1014_16]
MFPIAAHDFPYLFPALAASNFSLPYTWSPASHDALGVFTTSTLWDWPYGLLYGLGAKIGLDFTLSIFLLGILPAFIISWFAMGKLLKSYSLSTSARLIGQSLFATNTFILMLIDGGQLSLAIAYSLIPLAIYYISARSRFILVTLTISFLDIRFLYLLVILASFHTILNLRQFKYYLITGLITGLVLVGAHSYWMLPSLFTKAPSLPTGYTRQSQVSSLSFASLTHAIFLIQPHWPKNIFGHISSPSPYFFLLPILAFLPLVVFPRNNRIFYWTGIALLSLFLVKGSQPPFPQVYPWLFSHIPGFSLFRDPVKFFTLLALSYSVLIAFSSQYLFQKNRLLPGLIVIYLLFLITPILRGQATGLFSKVRNPDSYLQLARFLESDPNPGGIVWIPSKPPLGYSSPTHPSTDALTLLNKRPFSTGVVGSYDLLNFLREASYSGQLLDIASVKYLGFAAIDPLRDSLKPQDVKYRQVFTNQLSRLPWVKSRLDFGPVTLLETKTHQNLFFVPASTSFIIGSDDIYQSDIDLTKTALVFAEEKPGILSQISQFPQSKLLLNRKRQIDVAAALISPKDFIFPAQQLNFDPDHTGWWKRETSDLISWRDFLQQKYSLDNLDFDFGGGWAVSEGNNSLTVNLNSCGGDCVVLARFMVSPQGGKIEFSGSAQKTIATTSDRAEFLWFEIGQVSSPTSITIATEGHINVVNALAVIPISLWQQFQSQADRLINYLPPPPSSTQPEISYVKHNPTSYTVNVKKLSAPATLAFSQNYDSFWRLDNKAPVPLYSFINGFSIPGSGEYIISFSPQRYVLPGLIISSLTLITFSVISFLSWKRVH